MYLKKPIDVFYILFRDLFEFPWQDGQILLQFFHVRKVVGGKVTLALNLDVQLIKILD